MKNRNLNTSFKSKSPNTSFYSNIEISEKKQFEKFDPKIYLLPETTEEEILKYKEIFDLLDTYDGKSITPFDLHKAFLAHNYKIPKRFIYQIISDFDGSERGVIKFDDFVKMMVMTPCKDDTEDEIRQIFEQIDRNSKGYIDKNDFKELLAYLNKEAFSNSDEEKINDEEINKIFNTLTNNSDGKITWKIFLNFNKNFHKRFPKNQ